MGVEILWAGIQGWGVLLIWGILLALFAARLPRFLARLEAAPDSGRLGPQELSPPSTFRPRPEPTLPETAPLPSKSIGEIETEEPLVAAAIALALTLYQQDQAILPEVPPASQVGSPWALAGRWQGMQARLHLKKR